MDQAKYAPTLDIQGQHSPKEDYFQRLKIKIKIIPVWWDYKGIVYFELLRRNQTIDSNAHYRDLSKLNETNKRPELANRKGVMFQETTPFS